MKRAILSFVIGVVVGLLWMGWAILSNPTELPDETKREIVSDWSSGGDS